MQNIMCILDHPTTESRSKEQIIIKYLTGFTRFANLQLSIEQNVFKKETFKDLLRSKKLCDVLAASCPSS